MVLKTLILPQLLPFSLAMPQIAPMQCYGGSASFCSRWCLLCQVQCRTSELSVVSPEMCQPHKPYFELPSHQSTLSTLKIFPSVPTIPQHSMLYAGSIITQWFLQFLIQSYWILVTFFRPPCWQYSSPFVIHCLNIAYKMGFVVCM